MSIHTKTSPHYTFNLTLFSLSFFLTRLLERERPETDLQFVFFKQQRRVVDGEDFDDDSAFLVLGPGHLEEPHKLGFDDENGLIEQIGLTRSITTNLQ